MGNDDSDDEQESDAGRESFGRHVDGFDRKPEGLGQEAACCRERAIESKLRGGAQGEVKQ